MSAGDIIKSINPILEAAWTKKQLHKGKWFEIQSSWTPNIIQTIVSQYKDAGWRVARHAELTQKCTRIFLVIAHPKYYESVR